jgi:hypothetical protein
VLGVMKVRGWTIYCRSLPIKPPNLELRKHTFLHCLGDASDFPDFKNRRTDKIMVVSC